MFENKRVAVVKSSIKQYSLIATTSSAVLQSLITN